MRLRAKVIVGVAAANLTVFVGLGAILVRASRAEEANARAYRAEIGASFVALLRALGPPLTGGEGAASSVPEILRWPGWGAMRDAVVVKEVVATARGFAPVSGFLNPLGARHRSAAFDLDDAVERLARAKEERRIVEAGDGFAFPVESRDPGAAKAWGGAYFVPRVPRAPASRLTLRDLALAMLASIALGTALTLLGLSKWVVKPVVTLATTSRRIASGEDAPLPESSPGGDEVAGLVRSFSTMVATIRGHRSELEREVANASARAAKAERELLLAQRLAATGTLAAGIAHEINNPLGGMLNAARALRAGTARDRDEYLDLLLEGLERIRGIVGRVLEITPRGGEPERVVLARPAETALAFVQHRMERGGIEVVRRIDEDAAVRGDGRALGQVFLNLLLNAADALEARPRGARRVEVEVRREGGSVVASVADNGPGMDPAVVPRAFDLFFTTKPSGSGLGLSMVYAVVRDHGGTVELANRPGKGLAVVLRIPALAARTDAGPSRSAGVG